MGEFEKIRSPKYIEKQRKERERQEVQQLQQKANNEAWDTWFDNHLVAALVKPWFESHLLVALFTPLAQGEEPGESGGAPRGV